MLCITKCWKYVWWASIIANESLVPCNIIKRAPGTQNLYYYNIESQLKANEKIKTYSPAFKTKDFVL